jgi:hypothetical protein
MTPRAVFLMLLLLAACKDSSEGDFEQAWASYKPIHVSGSDTR